MNVSQTELKRRESMNERERQKGRERGKEKEMGKGKRMSKRQQKSKSEGKGETFLPIKFEDVAAMQWRSQGVIQLAETPSL